MIVWKGVLAASCAIILMTGLAEAAPKKSAGKVGRSATEMIVINERSIELTDLSVADQTGRQVARLTAPIAPGKRATLKLVKGSTCIVSVSTAFADEGESEGTTDLCKDKTVHLKD